jgi:trimethylamine--corrinoid protein Co-methyltransferase
MSIAVKILTDDQLQQVHERSLKILSQTGLKVESEEARAILKKKGAVVSQGDSLVKFPKELVSDSLQVCGRDFALGGRRADWSFRPAAGDSTLCMSGEAVFLNEKAGVRPRSGLNSDWLDVTRLGDAIDEVGIYWRSITPGDRGDRMEDYIDYLRLIIENFSKHIQDPFQHKEQAPWLLEVLSAVYGGREAVIEHKPFSTLFCPQSPLTLKGHEIDAILALRGWSIPIAVMPMALMGATAPASLPGTLLLTNTEVLASICLFESAEPGIPIIYAPVLTMMEPRTGAYFAGGIEQGLMNGAAAQMGKFYNLSTMITGLETDAQETGYQAAEDKNLISCLPFLSGADIFIGPGIVGSDMTLSLEQFVLDVEIFRKLKVMKKGFTINESYWLDEVINEVGPGGNFLAHASTVKNIRKQWYAPKFGRHGTLENWFSPQSKDCLEQARQEVGKILQNHSPLALEDKLRDEINLIRKKAQSVQGSFPFV